MALASSRSKGSTIDFGENKSITVGDLAEYDFSDTDIAIFSPGAKISSEFAPKAAKKGCIVIDNTSHFRTDPDRKFEVFVNWMDQRLSLVPLTRSLQQWVKFVRITHTFCSLYQKHGGYKELGGMKPKSMHQHLQNHLIVRSDKEKEKGVTGHWTLAYQRLTTRRDVWRQNFIPENEEEKIELTTERLFDIVAECHKLDQDGAARRVAREDKKWRQTEYLVSTYAHPRLRL